MTGSRRWFGLRAAVVIVHVLFFAVIASSTVRVLELGGDEGCELLKAAMHGKGFDLYSGIWNDQPPLYTVVLARVLGTLSNELLASRLFAAGVGLLLVLLMFGIVQRQHGLLAGTVAAMLFLAAPQVLLLSFSVMLEPAAMCVALLSTICLFQWHDTGKRSWLILSGVVMGAALQVKLTAVIFAPALLSMVFMKRGATSRRGLPDAAQWGAAVCFTVGIIVLIWGRGSLQQALASHFQRPIQSATSGAEQSFDWSLARVHYDCIFAACAAVVLAIRTNQLQRVAFPTVLLATVGVVHAIHRPWWSYYYLHFAIPVAWLSALLLSELVGEIHRKLWVGKPTWSLYPFLQIAGLCVFVLLVLMRCERRIESELAGIQAYPSVFESAIVREMKKRAGGTTWVYSEREVYPFHAQLKVPPELVVVPAKRVWSGQISIEAIVDTCRRYNVDQLVLKKANTGHPEWQKLLSKYKVICEESGFVLYAGIPGA